MQSLKSLIVFLTFYSLIENGFDSFFIREKHGVPPVCSGGTIFYITKQP